MMLKEREAIDSFNRGCAYQRQGYFSYAIAQFTNAIAFFPNNNEDKARAYFNRGVIYQTQGKLPEAIADYTQAIALFPNNGGKSLGIDKAHACHNRGMAYKAQGKFPEAIADFGHALKLYPRLAKEIILDDFKHFYKEFYAFYREIRNYLPPRTRLNICYEGEVSPHLTDRNGSFLLMNEPVILLCCMNTFDLETLENLPKKYCPCCRKPFAASDLFNPKVNLLVKEIIADYVKEKEDLAEQQRLISSTAVASEQKENQPQDASPDSSSSSLASEAALSPQREAVSRKAWLARVERNATQSNQLQQNPLVPSSSIETGVFLP
jgi:hypothetical protein